MQRETGKDGEPSDHNASLILSEREKEERLSGMSKIPVQCKKASVWPLGPKPDSMSD